MKPMESNRMLILSLSTGIAKKEEKYTAVATSKWGLFNWVYDNGSAPLPDVYGDESSDMVDIHVSTLFQSLRCTLCRWISQPRRIWRSKMATMLLQKTSKQSRLKMRRPAKRSQRVTGMRVAYKLGSDLVIARRSEGSRYTPSAV
ncbi:hypothetical protein U1Q18_047556 [Sarracenia purpurea var. burkii]